MNTGGIKWHWSVARAAVTVAAVTLLAGCTGAGAGQAEAGTSSAAPTSSASPAPSGPTGKVIAVTPAPGVAPIPSETSEPLGRVPSMEEMAAGVEETKANVRMVELFLATAWDTMEPRSLSDMSIGDCLYFDYDYESKTTALFTVDCSTPHEGEVMAIYRHPDSAYPGQSHLGKIAGETLLDAANVMREAGQLPTSALKPLSPTEADWQAGERTSILMLFGDSSSELLERGYFDPDQVTVYEVPDLGPAVGETPNALHNAKPEGGV